MAGQAIAYFFSRALLLRNREAALPSAPTLAVLFMSRPVPVLAEAVVFSAGASRMSWPQFLLACGSGNMIYAGALALNGVHWLPVSFLGPGLLLPMLLPVAAWLIWRSIRRVDDQGDR
jgi:membrane protein DedA with SNARE-associated domain